MFDYDFGLQDDFMGSAYLFLESLEQQRYGSLHVHSLGMRGHLSFRQLDSDCAAPSVQVNVKGRNLPATKCIAENSIACYMLQHMPSYVALQYSNILCFASSAIESHAMLWYANLCYHTMHCTAQCTELSTHVNCNLPYYAIL